MCLHCASVLSVRSDGCNVLWSPSGSCGQTHIPWVSLLFSDTCAGTMHFPSNTGIERTACDGDEI